MVAHPSLLLGGVLVVINQPSSYFDASLMMSDVLLNLFSRIRSKYSNYPCYCYCYGLDIVSLDDYYITRETITDYSISYINI